MTEELKTLKDIEFRDTIAGDCVNIDIDWLNEVNVSLLRAEAIKWCKEVRKRNQRDGYKECYESEEQFGDGMLITFFNLTEEDLK